MTDQIYVICVTVELIIGLVRAMLSVFDVSLLLYTLITMVSELKSQIKSEIELEIKSEMKSKMKLKMKSILLVSLVSLISLNSLNSE